MAVTNHQVGVPFGLEMFDFPSYGDNLSFVAMWLISLVTSDVAKVVNIFFLLTFPAEAISGYAVLRWLGASRPSSVVAAILFADAPYHLFRGETHLLLSNYATIPLATYLIISILDGRRVVTGSLRPLRLRSFASWRNGFVLSLCVLIGSTGTGYYGAFTMLLLGAAGLATAARLRAWAPLVQAVAIIIALLVVTGINDAPTLVYRHLHGTNPVAAKRYPQESEMSLKLAEMVMPVPGERIGALARLRSKYDTTNPVPGDLNAQALGVVGVVGLAVMLLVALGAIGGVGAGGGPERIRLRELSFATMVAFVIGTLGGISALIGYLVTTQIRGWDRISIFIDFAALAAVALGMDMIARRWLRGRRSWALLGLGAVLAIGVYDASSRFVIPAYTANGFEWGSDALFVNTVQRVLPPGSSVFQLPYMPFPEVPPINAMQDYDPLRAYLHSTDLKWSYPVMEARPSNWDSQTVGLPPTTLVDGVIAAGFSGIWIDHAGYVDGGRAIVGELRALLGEAPLTSRDRNFSFFDLRSYAARLRSVAPPAELSNLRTAILHPAVVTWGGGFYPPEWDGSRWAVDRATGDGRQSAVARTDWGVLGHRADVCQRPSFHANGHRARWSPQALHHRQQARGDLIVVHDGARAQHAAIQLERAGQPGSWRPSRAGRALRHAGDRGGRYGAVPPAPVGRRGRTEASQPPCDPHEVDHGVEHVRGLEPRAPHVRPRLQRDLEHPDLWLQRPQPGEQLDVERPAGAEGGRDRLLQDRRDTEHLRSALRVVDAQSQHRRRSVAKTRPR